MLRISRLLALTTSLLATSPARSADFGFFGRSGDAIQVKLSGLPGVAAGSSFSGLNLSGFGTHTALTSDLLTGQPFASTGEFWILPDPARNTAALGDANPNALGFQGQLSGSLLINGVERTFNVTVQPGYTGAGPGSVGQSLEAQGRAQNNKLYVAQQQQRLRYFGYVSQGGAPLVVDGDFGPATATALKTFQATFMSGVNVTQANADGIVGPGTAGWLNAANAPIWQRLVNSTNGDYTLTANLERYGTSWTLDLFYKGAAAAKAATGITQDTYGISTIDGYGSSQWHTTHRVGTDIDLATVYSTWNYGNGVMSADEQKMVQQALAFIDSGASGKVIRIISSNADLLDGIKALRPNVPLYYDPEPGHLDHFHIDVGPPPQAPGRANLAGDFNLDDVVNAADLAVWRQYYGMVYTGNDFLLWQRRLGTSQPPFGTEATLLGIPEPRSLALLAWGLLLWRRGGRGRTCQSGSVAVAMIRSCRYLAGRKEMR